MDDEREDEEELEDDLIEGRMALEEEETLELDGTEVDEDTADDTLEEMLEDVTEEDDTIDDEVGGV